MTRLDRIGWVVAAAVVVLLAGLPFTGHAFWVSFGTRLLVFGIFAASLNLLIGRAGMVSFGHAAFFGLGAFAPAILIDYLTQGGALPLIDREAPVWLTLLGSVLVAGVAAAVVGALVVGTSGVYFIMATLAFAQMFYYFFFTNRFYASSGGDDGIQVQADPVLRLFGHEVLALSQRADFFWFVLVLAILSGLFLFKLSRSPFGWVLVGIRENEDRMASFGYNVALYKWVAFVIAGGVAGLAGSLYASALDFVHPSYMAWDKSGSAIIMVILGGQGTVFGPFVGAMLYEGLKEVLATYTDYWPALFGVLLVAVVLFTRGGAVGFVLRLLDRDEAT